MTTTNALESFFPELRSELAQPESEAILTKRRRIAELEESHRASQLAAQMAEKKLNQTAAATNSKKRTRVEMDAKEPSLSSSTTISSSEEEDEDLEKSESIGGDDEEEEEEEEEEDEDDEDDDVSTDESQQEREFEENKRLVEKAKKKKLEKLNTKKPKKSVSPSASQKQPSVSRKEPTTTALYETLMGDEKEEHVEEVLVSNPLSEPIQDREEKLKEILETVKNTIHHEENLHHLNSALKKSVEDKLVELKSKETDLSERENALEEKLKELKKKEMEFNWKESLQNEGRDKEAQVREKSLLDKEKEIKQREQDYEKLALDMNNTIAKHEEAVKKFEAMKSEWSKKEKELKNAQEKYAKESKELREARFTFNEKENSLKLEENKWLVANRAVENDRVALNKQTESLKKQEMELTQLHESIALSSSSNQQLSTGIIDKIVADTIANNVKEFNESLLSILTESQQKQYVPGFFRDELILNTAHTTDYQVTLIRHKEKKNLVFFQMAGK